MRDLKNTLVWVQCATQLSAVMSGAGWDRAGSDWSSAAKLWVGGGRKAAQPKAQISLVQGRHRWGFLGRGTHPTAPKRITNNHRNMLFLITAKDAPEQTEHQGTGILQRCGAGSHLLLQTQKILNLNFRSFPCLRSIPSLFRKSLH